MAGVSSIFARQLPPPRAVAGVSSAAVALLGEAGLGPAAEGVVVATSPRTLLSSDRVVVLSAILLATLPAPCATTAGTHVELVIVIQSTCEDIVTRGVLQGPATAPRTGLCIR